MFCGACGQQMSSDARFCCHCGKPIQSQQQGWNFGNFGSERLTRPRQGRMLAGVCEGIARHYGWDTALVRVLAVVVFFFGCGAIFIAYIAAWIIMPNEPLYFMTPPPPPANYTSGPAGTVGGAPVS